MRMVYLYTFLLFIFASAITAQEEANTEEETDGVQFFFGLNIGGLKANGNTAVYYNGDTPYGVYYQFHTITNKPVFDQYFKYNYKIEELPQKGTISYNTAYNIGGFAGLKLDESISVYAELNISKLKIQDAFSVAISNPNDPTTFGDTYEQIPIFGTESRSNLNIGVQATFYQEEKFESYFNFFGNVNNTRLEDNYFVINNKKYTIFHNVSPNGSQNGQLNLQQTVPPGGIGFGGGAGLGARYIYNETFTFDLNYNATYARTRMSSDFKPFGLQHSAVVRILWGF